MSYPVEKLLKFKEKNEKEIEETEQHRFQNATTRDLIKNLKFANELIDLLTENKINEFFLIIRKENQGLLSEKLFNTETFKTYALEKLGILEGYFSMKNYRRGMDRFIEQMLTSIGMSHEEIAYFLGDKKSTVLKEMKEKQLDKLDDKRTYIGVNAEKIKKETQKHM